MSNVLVEKNKLDLLANAIAGKSGEPLTLTLDEMVEAVDGIETGGGGITPTGNINITQAGQTDVTNYATATVPDGLLKMSESIETSPYISINNNGLITADVNDTSSSFPVGYSGWLDAERNAVTIYIYGNNTYQLSTQAATTITPTESSQTAVASGKYTTGAVTVNAIPSNYVGSGITQRSSSDLSASGATVTVPSGYYSAQASKAVSSGTATPASTISGTSATVSTGTNTLTLSKTVSNTPQVSAGYISSGTAGNSSVSLTASVTTKGTATITPTTTNQTIASGTYLTGTQTISGDSNLVAGNIKSGTSIFGITGTYTGGGGSSDVAMGTLTVASNVNTSTSTQITTTTAIGFTPTKFFFYRSDRSATSNHVNQASFVTLGTSYYVRTMTRYSSNALSTSGNTNNWTTQTAGYLYFNSNTIYFRSSSSYILPSGTWNWVAVK